MDGAIKALEALPPGSNGRDVLEALACMVSRSGLKVGDRLPPEIDIAQKLGISRGKVREALTAWQNMGIVSRNKRAGTRLAAEVTSNSIQVPLTLKLETESLLRTVAVRRPLELEAVRLTCRRMTPEHSKKILARAAELIAVHGEGLDWRKADSRFHAVIHEGTGNPLFAHVIGQIQHGFHAVYSAPLGQPHLGEKSIPLHLPLAQAIVSGDEEEAVQIMDRILDLLEEDARQVMEAQLETE